MEIAKGKVSFAGKSAGLNLRGACRVKEPDLPGSSDSGGDLSVC